MLEAVFASYTRHSHRSTVGCPARRSISWRVLITLTILFVLWTSVASRAAEPLVVEGNYFDTFKRQNSAAPKPGKHVKACVVLKFFGTPYDQLLAQGIHSLAEYHGLTIEYQAGSSDSDQEGQRSKLEGMLDRGCTALLVESQTDTSLDSSLTKAHTRGVALVAVGEPIKYGIPYVGPDHYENGAMAARYFLDKLHAQASIGLLLQGSNVPSASRAAQGFAATIAAGAAGRMHLVGPEYCGEDLQSAIQSATAMLKKQPGLSGIFCTNDILALGAVQAVKHSARADRVLIVSVGGGEEAYEALTAGKISALIDTFPVETGAAALDILFRRVAGRKTPPTLFTRSVLVLGGEKKSSP